MWGRGQRRNNATCSGLIPFPITSPTSLYVAGTFLAAALVLNPRMSGFAHVIGSCKSFKYSPKGPTVSSPAPTPTVFLQPEFTKLYFLALEPRAALSALGLRSLAPQVSLLVFICHMWIWDWLFCWPLPCHHHLASAIPHPLRSGSLAPPLLPIWMNISFLNPWFLDFLTVWFSGSSNCY